MIRVKPKRRIGADNAVDRNLAQKKKKKSREVTRTYTYTVIVNVNTSKIIVN